MTSVHLQPEQEPKLPNGNSLKWRMYTFNLKESFRFLSAFLSGSRGCYRFITPFSRGLRSYWGQIQLLHGQKPGHILDESPAHRRSLTDGRGCHTGCQPGAILGFSILLKDTSTCSSVPPGGAGIRTSEPQLYVEKRPSSQLSYQLFIPFLSERCLQTSWPAVHRAC